MINVGVLFGSRSVEHEVSVITALQAIYQLVDNREYKIVPIYISKTGDWYTGDLLFDLENFKDLNKIMSGTQILFVLLKWLQLNRTKMFTL